MNNSGKLISQLYSIRNSYGNNFSTKKLELLQVLNNERAISSKAIQSYYSTLLFLLAYPDNRSVYKEVTRSLQQLQLYIKSHPSVKDKLFNSGITETQLCAAYSFEIVKWLRQNHPQDIRFSSFEADKAQIQSILSVVMPKVESEILQDGNASWKPWLKQSLKKGEELLDRLIAVFDEADIRPEVRDELWVAMEINVEIDFSFHNCLPASLFSPYYHHSLLKKLTTRQELIAKPIRVKLDETEAKKIIKCGRMILVRHLREIDPVTFTAPGLVSYYLLPRGFSIALMGIVPDRRQPIDCYMGYVVFKNGLPVAYAGSWILFDSGRIGLNVFPAYRGGESRYIFDLVLEVHRKVYRLNRFSVDPYQVGKDNSDGIHSGAFWIYYRAGFRPIGNEQKLLAESEAKKISADRKYRSPASVLKKLADCRSELIMHKKAFRFDATDLSRAYASILKNQYSNNRKLAEEYSFKKLVKLLQIKNYHEGKLQFIIKNWCVLLLSNEKELRSNKRLKKLLKTLFVLKASGSEEDYITALQKEPELRKFLKKIIIENPA